MNGGERRDFKRQDADVSVAFSSQANAAWLNFNVGKFLMGWIGLVK
jgi:hypothetical protein